MRDQLTAVLVAFAFGLLDRWLDKRIEALAWDGATKARAHLLEDELVRWLEPIVGELAKTFAPKLVGKALARAFPNDPSTGSWG